MGAAAVTPAGREMHCRAPLGQAPYGTLRGESGRYYMPVRFNHVMMTPRLHLPVTPMGGQAVDTEAAIKSFYGYIQSDVIGDRWLLQSRGKPGRGFSFEVTPGDKAIWREEGIFELEMRATSGRRCRSITQTPTWTGITWLW